MKLRLMCIATLALVSACNGNGGLNIPGMAQGTGPQAQIYDASFAKRNFVVGKTSLDDVQRLCGDTPEKRYASDGSEYWTYRSDVNSGGYAPGRSTMQQMLAKAWSHVPSNEVTGAAANEYNLATGGNGVVAGMTNQLMGKPTGPAHMLQLYFKQGVLQSYSLN
ncbi:MULTISPECIES: hypothetical protein [Pseudomonas]|uniref:Lipoprotein n=1 Tax=Pseudomonas piscis TaxID=2614538 RepID=A0ABY9NAG4_9PSED|nr:MULTISPECIES: hypothetical protein [Pseudomonas]AZC19273.1 hypothetical protein C4K40_3888 [Pseudomonas sp. CMR5c]MBC2658901.1 hypothetical protein [Pseudomonas sp. MSSRFD41]MCU7647284.1 hypothetical protein [Pseudomonas piscis]WMN15500.1 hypothetical protein QL104_19245 [Pseudomonas piscis]